MSIFWQSRSDEVKEEIQDLVGQMNRLLLRTQDSLVNNNGVTDLNVTEIEDLSQKMIIVHDHLLALSYELSNAKIATLNVPWLDGRYFPLPMWMGSYNLCVTKIQNALIAYANSF